MTELNTVLLVEDERVIRQILRESLDLEGFVVLEAALISRAEDILKQHPIDAIILDLNLPDGNSIGFLKNLRQHTDVPVVVLSGEEDEKKRVESFEAGADDFVPKPFNPFELQARIKAHIRRYREMSGEKNIQNAPVAMSGQDDDAFGCWRMDRAKFQIFNAQGQSAGLTPREFRLLDFLITHAGRVLPRAELCQATREANYVPTPRAIDVKITRIRRKLGDDADNPQIIETMRGVGYMFNRELLK